ncbi:hypothetical protein LTR62_005851 [Meristemomyces frigidus]|uniref:Uncharacterized protein n=1 Tax=Meristemomyces frigidus TaxID=1508187 RepID=A0AAN7TQG6_9PEZI|nr:hypothetical protein LTR62_005851 [Meristemomyces frigidus]
MDEQESAQKLMSRKLEVLETGFSVMHGILLPKHPTDLGDEAAHESRIPFLDTPTTEQNIHDSRERILSMDSVDDNAFPIPPHSRTSSTAPDMALRTSPTGLPGTSYLPTAPGPHLDNRLEPYPTDYDPASLNFPTPSSSASTIPNGPYISPLHHLLSMHESLRDEMTRMSAALQELDGRHSMQTLNENLRTREEISYFGAQLAGLSRQVHWLTSERLQRMQGGRAAGTPGSGSGGEAPSSATAGMVEGVGAAVSAVSSAASALSTVGRVVGVGQAQVQGQMRRENSAEGRTKL